MRCTMGLLKNPVYGSPGQEREGVACRSRLRACWRPAAAMRPIPRGGCSPVAAPWTASGSGRCRGSRPSRPDQPCFRQGQCNDADRSGSIRVTRSGVRYGGSGPLPHGLSAAGAGRSSSARPHRTGQAAAPRKSGSVWGSSAGVTWNRPSAAGTVSAGHSVLIVRHGCRHGLRTGPGWSPPLRHRSGAGGGDSAQSGTSNSRKHRAAGERVSFLGKYTP